MAIVVYARSSAYSSRSFAGCYIQLGAPCVTFGFFLLSSVHFAFDCVARNVLWPDAGGWFNGLNIYNSFGQLKVLVCVGCSVIGAAYLMRYFCVDESMRLCVCGRKTNT